MLVLTGILILLLFFSITIKNLSVKNRSTFIMFNASATLLLLADRYAYIFRGDPSELGFWMVRICNFLTFLMTITVVFFYNALLKSMIGEVSDDKKVPMLLHLVDICCGIHVLLVIVSQFTGLLYTFDASNTYQRSTLSFLGYIMPLTCMVLQFIVAYRYRDHFSGLVRVAVFLFSAVPILSGIIQLFIYGISLIDISTAIMVILLYVIVLNDMNRRAERTDSVEMDHLREQQQRTERLLDQTTTTLIAALDAKEEYTQGHSIRVARYAREIAKYLGKDEKECDEIYYAGLLHDIGKIGIPDEIINKNGKLTPEEYEIMKQHPTLGRHILSGITEMPYLAIGANFHHERYDGKGYPEGLAGEDIPELGRILAVADAYDAMSSNRSYRDAIPQQKIREEFIKNSGTQFDPTFAKVMQHLIDLDSEYQMKEKSESVALADDTRIICGEYREAVSEGILINENPTLIRLIIENINAAGMPAMLLFDSLDAKVYTEEPLRKDMNYFEYGEIMFDGETTVSGARKMQVDTKPASEFHKEEKKPLYADLLEGSGQTDSSDEEASLDTPEPVRNIKGKHYEITAVRFKDHAQFTIHTPSEVRTVIVALPDNARFLYVGITGRSIRINDLAIERSERKIGEGDIPRIAEEISYIKGPAGDVPNIQIDGYRTEATEGFPIRDGMELHFHTMSLPTARLVWHTAFIDIFSSDNKLVDGPNYTEYALIRLDGEYWDDSHGLSENDMEVLKRDDFTGWDDWKDVNKAGMDVVVRFLRRGDKITTITENNSIAIRNTTTIKNDVDEVYVALSGDQVALTQIRVDLSRSR